MLKMPSFIVIVAFLALISSTHGFLSPGFHSRSKITRSQFRNVVSKHHKMSLMVSGLRRVRREDNKFFMSADGVTENDPILIKLREELDEIGVELDQLMNPAKVVNLEVDLINLKN